jgi:hypothetical protein
LNHDTLRRTSPMPSLSKHLSSAEGTRMVPTSVRMSLGISLEQILTVSAASEVRSHHARHIGDVEIV